MLLIAFDVHKSRVVPQVGYHDSGLKSVRVLMLAEYWTEAH